MKSDKDQFNYWQLRDLQDEQDNQDEATDKLNTINQAYQKAQVYLSDEVKKIYRRYFYADISADEVESIMSSHISPSELVTLKALSNNITDKDSKKAVNDYLNRLAAKSRITRLEEMQVKAYIVARSAGAVELEQNVKLHTNVMERAWKQAEKQGVMYDKARDYKLGDDNTKPKLEQQKNEVIIKDPKTGKKLASVPMKFDEPKTKLTKMPNRYVERALNSRWNGGNFSSRIWDNTDKLADRLKELFTVKELSNMSEREMIKRIDQEFNVGKFNASRLIRTEVNYFYSKTKLDNWKSRGVKQYQLIAILDSRTSKICRSINKKIFNVKDAIFGKNMPPLHPFCRTVPVIYLGVSKDIIKDDYDMIKELLGEDMPSKKVYNGLKNSGNSYWNNLNVDIKRRLDLKKHPEKMLPNLENMVFPETKFTEYLFEHSNDKGWPKGKIIKEKLGYDIDNYLEYVNAIKKAARIYPAKYKVDNGYGKLYEQKIMLYNEDGIPINVIVGWIVMHDDPKRIKYTSSYVKEVKKNE
ncbi:minor capsid protein [Ligilactobacillus murinus]|uniref:minor capsid protein n=1 Tax=Ligilactobacillus murinus TaxID=1622 RepID=UPI001C8BA5FB|nr:minor capsid protein [Ligilactobacillus murinus]MBX9012651.1 minor capsid protein [Ligilactobacillus murinus]